MTGKELPTPLPFFLFNFPIFNADLAIVAAAPLSTSRARCKPAGGSVAALIIALLCEKKNRRRRMRHCRNRDNVKFSSLKVLAGG